ncbi:MAG TPA: nitrogenase component 1 [Fibrobacteraceae bacterium]|nr:nitrogenase component 1 [Fibrobacteraceae bacterium]
MDERPSFRQCGRCAAPPVLKVLSTYDEIAVLLHSGAGCSGSFADFQRAFHQGLRKRGLPLRNALLFSTDLREIDLVCGPEDKLRQALRWIWEHHHPRAIVVGASCGSSITGSDIQPVLEEMQGEIPIPLSTIVCELYGKKRWGGGFDGERYPVFRDMVRPGTRQGEFYNIIDFSGGDDLQRLLRRVPVQWNWITRFGTYASLERMADARGTFRITADRLSNYLAEWLETRYGVPDHPLHAPCGVQATRACLREIASAVGQPYLFDAVLAEEDSRWQSSLESLRGQLRDVRSYPWAMGLATRKLALLMRELGMAPLGAIEEGDVWQERPRRPRRHGPAGPRRPHFRPRGPCDILQEIQSDPPDLVVMQAGPPSVSLQMPLLWLDDEQEFFAYDGLVRFGQKAAGLLSRSGRILV